ncbi:MAG: ABC transporter permease [Deltaproteobacteria bacterium]|nr:ABC transporter permease [Deltaproteobacteria bacterium]
MQALIRNRFLLYNLIRRDISSRFVGSYAGLFWGLVHPAILLVVYSTVFVFILKVRLGPGVKQNFAEFLFCGLWAWIAFQEGILHSVNVVVGNPNLVKRMMFPVEVLIPASVLSALFLQLLGFSLFFVYLLAFGKVPVTGVYRLLLVCVPLILQILLTMGLGWILAALNVFIRDTAQMVAALLTVWFFLTPIIYSVDVVPEGVRFLLDVNPWTHLVGMYRDVVFEGRIGLGWGTIYVCVLGVVVFIGGNHVFQKLKPEFADAV